MSEWRDILFIIKYCYGTIHRVFSGMGILGKINWGQHLQSLLSYHQCSIFQNIVIRPMPSLECWSSIWIGVGHPPGHQVGTIVCLFVCLLGCLFVCLLGCLFVGWWGCLLCLLFCWGVCFDFSVFFLFCLDIFIHHCIILTLYRQYNSRI